MLVFWAFIGLGGLLLLLYINQSSGLMVPQEEWGSGSLRRRNCASNVNQPLPEFSATIRISRMYLKNSCALVQYFSNMMLVKMRNADVHFSLDIQVRNLFLVRRIASLRIFI